MELFPVTLLSPKILKWFLYLWQIGAPLLMDIKALPIRYYIAITLLKNQEEKTIFIHLFPIYILLGSTVEIILPTQIAGNSVVNCVVSRCVQHLILHVIV